MTAFNPIAAFRFWFAVAPTAPYPPIDSRLASVIGSRAIVSDTIYPYTAGRVQFQGSWWPAACEQAVTIVPGTVVQVVGRRNITLVVKPI